jgi:hypothetical protein
MKNVPYFVIAAVLLVLTSCSSASKLRRAEKLIVEAEAMGSKWKIDTITVKVPYSVPEVHVKEIHHALPGDTVRIEKERLKIKYVRLPGDSVFIEGKAEADTIYKEVPVTVTKTINAAGRGYSLWQLIILALVCLAAGFGVRAFMRR